MPCSILSGSWYNSGFCEAFTPTLRFLASIVMRKESQILLVRAKDGIWSMHGREAPPCDLHVRTHEEAYSQQPVPPEYSLSQASLSLDQKFNSIRVFTGPHIGPVCTPQEPLHRSPASAQANSPLQPPTSPGSSKIDIHPFLKLSRSGYRWMRRQTVRLSKKATWAARRKCNSHLALVL